MQAALPQGIVPFVFAKEYNVHPSLLSTGYRRALLTIPHVLHLKCIYFISKYKIYYLSKLIKLIMLVKKLKGRVIIKTP